MLKGLKKKVKQQQREQEASQKQIISYQSKKLQIPSYLLELNNRIWQQFLNGNSKVVEEHLQKLRHQEENYFTNSNAIKIEDSSVKFAINQDFQDQEDKIYRQRSKKRRKVNNQLASKPISNCLYCIENQQLILLSVSNFAYLALCKSKNFKNSWHFILAPIQHAQSIIGLDQQILEQIRNYQKCLIQMFDAMKLHVVFFQQFYTANSHIFIQAVTMPLKKAQDLPFFFKQVLQTIEGNWITHKPIIEIRKDKGGIQKQIPKQLAYFYIDFGIDYGFAHVIEDQKHWRPFFVYETLATPMGLTQFEIKSSEQYLQNQIQKKIEQFDKIWKRYDWTILLQK